MTYFDAIIQGILQGLSEFLPISSSGHLSVLQYLTGTGGEEGGIFAIFLHLGTLLAVFIAFRGIILKLIAELFAALRDIFTGKFSLKTMSPERRMLVMLVIATAPLIFVYFLKDFYTSLASDNDIIVEGIGFLITSSLLFWCVAASKKRNGRTEKDIKYSDALIVGFTQAVAPIPGISRSGSTIAAGTIAGLDKQFAVAFSFILGMPAVLAANIVELKDVVGSDFGIPLPVMAVGFVFSLVFGLLAIKLVSYISKEKSFIPFAWYTLCIGIVTIVLGAFHITFR